MSSIIYSHEKVQYKPTLDHLKPRVVPSKRKDSGWDILSGKHGSRKVVTHCATLPTAIQVARDIFCRRVMGRALRYEVLRIKGVVAAQ